MANNNNVEVLDVSVTSSFDSPIMFNVGKRGLEASASVLKDILLGNGELRPGSPFVEAIVTSNSLDSSADFADFDEVAPNFVAPPPPKPVLREHPQKSNIRQHPNRHSMHGRYSRSVGAPVNLNVQRVGPNARPQSNSPARLTCMTAVASPNTRRYSPPSGSVSSTKSPESTPRTSWDHTHNAAPLSTSSPRVARRGQPGGGPRAPYYVADTQSKQQPAYFIDEGINTSGGSGGSSSGSVFVPNFAPKIGVEPGGVLPHDTSLGASFASDNFQSQYDDSMYRLLPQHHPHLHHQGVHGPVGGPRGGHPQAHPGWLSSSISNLHAGSYTEEELQREYAVVLDALMQNRRYDQQHQPPPQVYYPCCSGQNAREAQFQDHLDEEEERALAEQFAAESRRDHIGCGATTTTPTTASNFRGHFYCNQQQPQSWQPPFYRENEGPPGCLSLNPAFQTVYGYNLESQHLETCVDITEEDLAVSGAFLTQESISAEADENDMVSWTGVSGVPGLGYSIAPKEEALNHHRHQSIAVHQVSNDKVWSANSASNLAKLKVDLPRINKDGSSASSFENGSNGSASKPAASKKDLLSKSNSASSVVKDVKNLPRLSKTSLGPQNSYHGLSAVSHLHPDLQVQQQQQQKAFLRSEHKSLRGLIGLKKSKHQEKLRESESGPRSLPSEFFVPRAPIPPPEVLASKKASVTSATSGTSSTSSSSSNKKHKKKSKSKASSVQNTPLPQPKISESPPVPVTTKNNFSAHNEAVMKRDALLYQSPNDREGDYSYAYDCSIPPAVVIKWTEDDDDEEGSDSNASSDEDGKNGNLGNKENIYEEIEDVTKRMEEMASAASGNSSSTSNSDSGIGGAVLKLQPGAASHNPGHQSLSGGTLDVGPRGGGRKKTGNRLLRGQKPSRPDDIRISSLDALLCQTNPDLTPHERLDLRKSLVDELFEELIQKHHKRVLDELKLDVEEFIAPNADQASIGTPKSSRSASSSGVMKRCESMDFKEQNLTEKEQQQQQSKEVKGLRGHLRKASEVFQRKCLLRKSASQKSDLVAFREEPQPQVTRRGRRPLSAVVTSTSAGKSAQVNRAEAEQADDYDSDSETENARRLQRSQIIKSFWEKHDAEEFEAAATSANPELVTATSENNNNVDNSTKKATKGNPSESQDASDQF